jgi:integrase
MLDTRLDSIPAQNPASDVMNCPHCGKRLRSKHSLPVCGMRRAISITASDIQQYVQSRHNAGASNGTINRELTAIRRAFCLAVEKGLIFMRPHISLLKENNTRQGFFEREQFEAVRRHLPRYLQPVASVAYITGWRIQSELLPLQWPLVEFLAGELRLLAGTTKNDEAPGLSIYI